MAEMSTHSSEPPRLRSGQAPTGAPEIPVTSARRRGLRWGWWAAAVARVGSNMVRRSRLLNAAASGARATLQSFTRVLLLLWLEVTGFLFLSLAVIGGLAGSRAYQNWSAGKMGPGRLVVAVCFTALFAWFGVSSFWRARRK